MNRAAAVLCGLCLALAFTAPVAFAQPGDDEVTIDIRPHVLNIRAPGKWVTVHADIPFSDVDDESVYLDHHLPAVIILSDLSGNLVAKFRSDDVRAIVSPGEVELTLDGRTADGRSFWGVDTIRVIERGSNDRYSEE